MGVFDIVGHAREIADVIKAYGNMELYQKIVDLQGELLKLSEDNLKLAERARTLEEQLRNRATLKRKGIAYFRTREDGGEDGPFCLICWDVGGKLVNLVRIVDGLKCNQCAKDSPNSGRFYYETPDPDDGDD